MGEANRDMLRPDTVPLKVYLKVRPDVVFLPEEGGLVVVSSDATMMLKGRSTSALGDWLSSHLDGNSSLDDVLDDISPRTRPALEQVIAALSRSGFLLEVADEERRESPRLREAYPEQIEFLSCHCAAPTALFRRFRETRFRIAGQSTLLRNLVAALADYGALHATLALPTTDVELEAIVAAANARDGERRFQVEVADRPPFQGEADIFIDAREDSWAPALEMLCARETALPFAGIYRTGAGIVVPLQLPGQAKPLCGRAIAATAGAPDGQPVAPAAAGIAAHHLVFSIFCERCGIDHGAAELLRVNQAELTTRRHRVLPHPGCPKHTPPARSLPFDWASTPASATSFPRSDIASDAASPEVRDEHDRIHEAIGALTDPLFGPLLSIGEGDLEQLPFARSEAAVRLYGPEVERAAVECVGLVARETRNQVALFALELWAIDQLRHQGAAAQPGSVVACGWSPSEAIFRALAKVAEGRPPPSRRDESSLIVERLSSTAIGLHLLDLAERLDPAALASPINYRRLPDGGWIAAWAESRSRGVFGATGAQAAGNLLFRRLAGEGGKGTADRLVHAHLAIDTGQQGLADWPTFPSGRFGAELIELAQLHAAGTPSPLCIARLHAPDGR